MPVFDHILENIYHGLVTADNLPLEIYLFTNSEVMKSVNKGFRAKITDFNITDPEYELLSKFERNVKNFSGVKTYHQVIDTERMVFTGQTKITKESFMQLSRQLSSIYNETWLAVEKDMALKMADSARDWLGFEAQKDIFPNLQYVTVGDNRVREDHAVLDGIIKPVNDSFWNSYMPPISWRCRCLAVQLTNEDGQVTPDKEIDFSKTKNEVDPLFDGNPGKTGILYRETGRNKHPYFNAPENLKENNFGFG